MTLAAAAYQGGLLLSQGEQAQSALRSLQEATRFVPELRYLDTARGRRFHGPCGCRQPSAPVVSLTQAAQWASAFDVRLALEFRGSSSFCSSLDTALALVAQCGEANVGVNLDVFHYYTGPSKFDDLALLSPANLAFVQLSDVLGVPRELATDADRILPGEGDFRLQAIVQQLRHPL